MDAVELAAALYPITRAVGMELKVKEDEELDQRLSKLEVLLEKQGGQSRWG
jgi:hypothetical protein